MKRLWRRGRRIRRGRGQLRCPLPLRENLPPPAQDHHAPCNCMPGEGQGGGESAAVAAFPDQGQTSSALQGCQTLERTSLASLGIESEDSHAGGPLRSASGSYARIEAGNSRSGRTSGVSRGPEPSTACYNRRHRRVSKGVRPRERELESSTRDETRLGRAATMGAIPRRRDPSTHTPIPGNLSC